LRSKRMQPLAAYCRNARRSCKHQQKHRHKTAFVSEHSLNSMYTAATLTGQHGVFCRRRDTTLQATTAETVIRKIDDGFSTHRQSLLLFRVPHPWLALPTEHSMCKRSHAVAHSLWQLLVHVNARSILAPLKVHLYTHALRHIKCS
jgi:hypothetical protein